MYSSVQYIPKCPQIKNHCVYGHITVSMVHGQCNARPTVIFLVADHRRHITVSMVHGQCNARPTVIFLVADHRRRFAGTKLVTSTCMLTTCPELLYDSEIGSSEYYTTSGHHNTSPVIKTSRKLFID